jgi:hypothetical protein
LFLFLLLFLYCGVILSNAKDPSPAQISRAVPEAPQPAIDFAVCLISAFFRQKWLR